MRYPAAYDSYPFSPKFFDSFFFFPFCQVLVFVFPGVLTQNRLALNDHGWRWAIQLAQLNQMLRVATESQFATT